MVKGVPLVVPKGPIGLREPEETPEHHQLEDAEPLPADLLLDALRGRLSLGYSPLVRPGRIIVVLEANNCPKLVQQLLAAVAPPRLHQVAVGSATVRPPRPERVHGREKAAACRRAVE